ncbi:MAG TPA: TonB-dependent receptor [Kofleriaceae bacterium]|nr:TonB-dependent receptor [Kofleriaceae bacterium]
MLRPTAMHQLARAARWFVPTLLLGVASAWGQPADAPAEAPPEPAPVEEPEPAPVEEPAPAPVTAPVVAPAPVELGKLTDAQLLELAEREGETIEIWDERPDKPFDRDTEVRLTGEELAQRGATDLASALALLPDVSVRDAGRGGFNVDIRGARKGAVRVLVDGVSVTDPYYGTFDVSTIPVTDIVQIRVSTAPASPIDGPGGPGGVIEVHTRDAIGARLVVARLTSDSLPTFGGSATGRTQLARDLSIRLSASGLWGLREFDLPSMAELGESRRATTGATRLEYRRGARRIAVDGFVDDRRYVPPPNEESANATILVIDRETTGRGQVAVDEQVGKLQLQGRVWTHALKRVSRYFRDAALSDVATEEDLFAMRTGGTVLATRPIAKTWRWVASATVDHERARVEALAGTTDLVSRGDVTLIEAAAGGQYEDGPVRVDAAAGAAVPIGLGADPWPEAKLVGRYKPVGQLELIATAAHKGRTPSLRERFDSQTGNPELGPEIATHGELRAIARPDERVEVDVAPYWRRSDGTMRLDPMTNRLTNLGTVDVRGLDASARVQVHPMVQLGGSYALTLDRSRNDDAGMWIDDPLDRLPDHRADGWIKGTPIDALTVVGRVRWFGEAIDRATTVDSYYLVEASASAQFGGDWLAVVRCDDLLDERPETRSGFHLPGRVFSLIVQGTWE